MGQIHTWHGGLAPSSLHVTQGGKVCISCQEQDLDVGGMVKGSARGALLYGQRWSSGR